MEYAYPWGYEESHQSLVNYNVALLGYHVLRWYLNDEMIIDYMKHLFRGFVVIVDIFCEVG